MGCTSILLDLLRRIPGSEIRNIAFPHLNIDTILYDSVGQPAIHVLGYQQTPCLPDQGNTATTSAEIKLFAETLTEWDPNYQVWLHVNYPDTIDVFDSGRIENDWEIGFVNEVTIEYTIDPTQEHRISFGFWDGKNEYLKLKGRDAHWIFLN